MVSLATVLLLALTGSAAYGKSPAVTLSAPKKVKAYGELHLQVRSDISAPFLVNLQQLRKGSWRTVATKRVGHGSVAAISLHVRSPLPYLTLRASVRASSHRGISHRQLVRIVRGRKTLRPGKIAAAPPPGRPGRVRYRGQLDLVPGDVLAAGIGPQTPDGFLGVVTSVSHSNGATELATQPTTLLAAVPSGSIDVETGSGGEASSSAGPRSVARVISCKKGGEVKVDGSVSIAPTISLQAKWSLFHGVTSAKFEAGVKMDGDLTASAQAAASCSAGPVTLAEWALPPIDIQVGPVPVVFVPLVRVVLKGNGSVSAEVSTGLHGSVTATGGIAYDDGDVHPVGGVTHSFTFDPPAPSATAHLGGSVGPTVALLLYGVAGPEVELSSGLSLDASTASNPWWKLTAPIDLGAKLSIPLLGLETGEKSIYHKSFLLAQASGAFGPPPPPAAGITFVGSPGTAAPPPTLGPYAMKPFGFDPQETGFVSGVDGPTGRLSFSTELDHVYANEEPTWRTWSHGYEGDVYASEEPSVTLSLPSGTKAFYLYAEPDEFATLNFVVRAQDGTSSGTVPVFGEYGAAFFGFYASAASTIQSVTVECPDDVFAIGEFGISSG